LAVQLIKHLLNPPGNIVLQVCHGLWTLQALKHKESCSAISMLDKTMLAEHETFEANLEARLSVAGASVMSAAVQQMNQNERNSFQSNCSAQRQNVLTKTAWESRQLLHTQQAALFQLDVERV
jgi:hypothetical protein